MSNIDKRALRESAEKALLAGDGKWSVWREAGQKYPEIFTSSGHIVATVNGAFPVARSDFIASANPTTVLALLDELEAKDRMVAELLNIISRHTIELGWGEKPISLAELIISREGSGSDALDAIRAAAAGKGEAS